jgi:L-rhamnose-H+ transport protein
VTNPFVGAVFHGIGALSSASCYTPQKQTKLWAWEVYWISQATCAWLILPIVFAFLTIPDYLDVLASCPPDAMRRSFLLGVIYGFGGLSFGLGIRYIGFSLNYAIAIGISAGLGTLFPLIWDPNKGFVWEIFDKFSDVPGEIVLTGIVLSLVGILFCGWAGALREKSGGASPQRYSFRRGVPLAVFAGVLSSIFNFALLAGKPLEDAALQAGASNLLKMNAIYPFSNGGAWVTNIVLCLFLVARNKTGSQFVRIPERTPSTLIFYYLMALLSGSFWYFQFFFYGIGQSFMGQRYEFTSWALHMAMLILFSNLYGALFREWEGADKTPKRILHAGMLVIVVATLVITWGNYWGNQLRQTPQPEAAGTQAFSTGEQICSTLSAFPLRF